MSELEELVELVADIQRTPRHKWIGCRLAQVERVQAFIERAVGRALDVAAEKAWACIVEEPTDVKKFRAQLQRAWRASEEGT